MNTKPALKHAPQATGFLLIPDFALMSYAAAIEPLRAANMLSERELYRWVHISADGTAVPASNGVYVSCDARIGHEPPLKRVFVCAAGNPAGFKGAAILRRLQYLARRGVHIGGVSAGPYILARAGLLNGYSFTIHWEHMPALAEDFPDLRPEPTLFVIDRERMTCAGGIAAFDMMHALIEADHGQALSTAVADWFLHTQVRPGGKPQRMEAGDRLKVMNAPVARALKSMEAHIEEPLTRGELASMTGVSPRHLDRLFAANLGMTVKAHYDQIRLERARTLLRQTDLSVLDVAIACGFQSASQFSRSFARKFKYPPGRGRYALKNPMRTT